MQVAPKVGKQSRLYRCAPEHLRNLSPRESENPEVREAPGMIHFPQALGSGVFQYQDLTFMNNSNNDVPSPSDQTNSSSNSSRALARAVAVQALAARGGAPLARSCLSRCPSRCHHLSADTRHVPEHTTIFLSWQGWVTPTQGALHQCLRTRWTIRVKAHARPHDVSEIGNMGLIAKWTKSRYPTLFHFPPVRRGHHMSHNDSHNMWSDMRFKRTENVSGLQKGFLDIKPMKGGKNLTPVVLLKILLPANRSPSHPQHMADFLKVIGKQPIHLGHGILVRPPRDQSPRRSQHITVDFVNPNPPAQFLPLMPGQQTPGQQERAMRPPSRPPVSEGGIGPAM